ncbi:MAG: AIR synthase-related protein, partial [Thermoanaerobaculia bacterium]
AVTAGDVLIGLPSVGLHTNGYSLARRILFDRLGYDHQTIIPDIGKAGEVLLAPHISYLKPLLPLVEERAIHAMAHITGGGLTDNVPRVLPDKLDAHIKLGSWPVLPIFKFLYEKGSVERAEMLRVFNMGIGMVLIVGKDEVDRVAKHFGQIGQTFYFMGNVVPGSGRVQYDTPPAGYASWIE